MNVLQHLVCVVVVAELHLLKQVERVDFNKAVAIPDHADILRVLPELGAGLREQDIFLGVIDLVTRLELDGKD